MTDPVNFVPVDPWTAVHFAGGFVAGGIGVGAGFTFASAVVWEILEPSVSPESIENQVVDVAIAMAGWWAGHALAGEDDEDNIP